jgi:hypothetical protein
VTTQGLLRNSAGLVVDGTYAVTFRLYAESTGGSPFWQETRSLNVTDGAFAAELGTVQPLPEGAFAAELPWVEFVVGNEPPLPRRPLTSAPHAIQADVASDVTCVGCVTATETSFMPAACTSGQVLKWGAAGWTCGSDVDSTYSGANFALSAKGCAVGSVMTGISTAGEPICANLSTGSCIGFSLGSNMTFCGSGHTTCFNTDAGSCFNTGTRLYFSSDTGITAVPACAGIGTGTGFCTNVCFTS